jgi:hypothetical protein
MELSAGKEYEDLPTDLTKAIYEEFCLPTFRDEEKP